MRLYRVAEREGLQFPSLPRASLQTKRHCSAMFLFAHRHPFERERSADSDSQKRQRFLRCLFVCGERGIRTPGGVTLNGFQDRRIRPLCHLSEKRLQKYYFFSESPALVSQYYLVCLKQVMLFLYLSRRCYFDSSSWAKKNGLTTVFFTHPLPAPPAKQSGRPRNQKCRIAAQ